ncbi:MAG: hypothetical protein ACYDGY_07655, partial [Acidimicrobiales bacterium]
MRKARGTRYRFHGDDRGTLGSSIRIVATLAACGILVGSLVSLAALLSFQYAASAVGAGWEQICTSSCKSPPARSEDSMAYDSATRQVVLFGGYGYTTKPNGKLSYTLLGDTWTWNGATWTQQHPAKSPPALFGGSMAYDSATRQVVLFGGGKTVRGSALAGTPL